MVVGESKGKSTHGVYSCFANRQVGSILAVMRRQWHAIFPMGLALLMVSCANRGSLAGHPDGTGPFDERGNYVEAWADNPSAWRKGKSGSTSEPAPDLPEIVQVDLPPSSTPVISTAPKPRPTTAVSSNRPKPTQVAVNTTRPKPKPVVVKPKPKPTATRYVVRKGDSLYAIAKRYGTSVTALQRANRISGTMIRPGQALTVPK